ncbi:MAG: response regulator [Gemmatimonadetes bacterium]|nr:response regulator [Gemmatimonadota bacterium]NNF12964.1 response regulator [Gemmatimonadota bacterium]
MMRLLVADDDSSLRLAIRLVLEDAGHDVLEASSVREVRGLITAHRPDFILIDGGMCQEGVDLWDELVSDIRYRGRVLLLTGDTTTLGALGHHDAVVGKPFDYERLLHRIEKAGPRPGGGTPVDPERTIGEDPPDDVVASS